MKSEEAQLFIKLLPPSWLMRESARVGVGVLVLDITLLVGRLIYESASGGTSGYLLANIVDIGIVQSLVLMALYLSLTGAAASRLIRYREVAGEVPAWVLVLVYPFFAAFIIASMVLALWVVDRDRLFYLAGAAISVLPVLIGMKFLELQRWFPALHPQFVMRLMDPGIDVMLGPLCGSSTPKHVERVVSFREEFAPKGWSRRSAPADHLYSEPVALDVFQSSLSSSYQVAPMLARLMAVDETFSRPWSLLDVGCGEGLFTSRFIDSAGRLPDSVRFLDIDGENLNKYRDRLSKVNSSIRLTAVKGSAQSCVSQCPSVTVSLASHSLYFIADKFVAKKDLGAAQGLLKEIVDRGNTCAIILASRASHAYSVKAAIYQHLCIRDYSSFAEDLLNILPRMPDEDRLVDTVMDVSEIIDDEEKLIQWFSYFCRIETSVLAREVSYLKVLLEERRIAFDSLPECDLDEIRRSGFMAERQRQKIDWVLMHKERIFLFRNPRLVRPDTKSPEAPSSGTSSSPVSA